MVEGTVSACECYRKRMPEKERLALTQTLTLTAPMPISALRLATTLCEVVEK